MVVFNKRYDGDWLVIELVPSYIVANTAIQFGSPTVNKTRVTTDVAGGAYSFKEWDDYVITEIQSLACACFEAGREYQRNRKLRKEIDDACSQAWALYNQKESYQPDYILEPECIGSPD